MSFFSLLLCTWDCLFSLLVAACHSCQVQPHAAKVSLRWEKNRCRNGEEEATDAFKRAYCLIAIIINKAKTFPCFRKSTLKRFEWRGVSSLCEAYT